MTRKVEAEELKREENKKRKLLSDSTSWVNETSSPTVASATVLKCVEADENDFYSELPGRRSFGGFNPSIERIYSNHCESMTAEKKINKEKEIVANLDKLVSLPRGPNQVMVVPHEFSPTF